MEEKKNEDKILKGILIAAGVIFLGIFVWMYVGSSSTHFDYKNVEFTIVEGIAPYRMSIPSATKDEITGAVTTQDFYMYLRNDPRVLVKTIPFENDVELRNIVIFKSKDEFNCEGKGIVGIMNLVRIYELLGIDVNKDPEAPCDSTGRDYTLIEIKSGNETRIDKIGSSCYVMQVEDCEILEATERYLLEVLSFVQEDLDNSNGP